MISCYFSKDGPLQLQEAWVAEYSNHIVPASEMRGCLTRQMPTLPGSGQAHNQSNRETLTFFLFLNKKKQTTNNTQAQIC